MRFLGAPRFLVAAEAAGSTSSSSSVSSAATNPVTAASPICTRSVSSLGHVLSHQNALVHAEQVHKRMRADHLHFGQIVLLARWSRKQCLCKRQSQLFVMQQ